MFWRLILQVSLLGAWGAGYIQESYLHKGRGEQKKQKNLEPDSMVQFGNWVGEMAKSISKEDA